MMARSSRLCIHDPRHSGLTTLRPVAQRLAHSYYTATSAHPVLAGPTRNVTGEAMPTSLAEALTQLSFLEFVQRCNLLIAPSQPTQLPAPISFLDVAVQTATPGEVSQDASTQTSDQPVSSLSLDVAVQTIFHSVRSSSLNAAVQTVPHSIFSQDVSTQMGSRPVSSFSVDTSMQTSIRSVVQHDAATQLPLTEFFIGCIYSNSPLDRQNPVRQSPAPMQGSHALLQPNSQPLPQSLLLIRTCSPMLAALPAIPSSRLSVPHMWEHTLYAQSPAPRGVPVPRSRGTHNSIGSNLRTDAGLFPKPKAVILPMVSFGQPMPNGPRPHCHS